MRNNIKFDFITNTIIVNKGYYLEACKYGTDEHNEFMQLKSDYPNMRISVRSGKTGSKKSNTKGLTYEYMRRFISILDEKKLLEFNKIQLYYEMFESDKTKVYHLVKEWFLSTYPHHKDMIIEATPQTKITAISEAKMSLCG